MSASSGQVVAAATNLRVLQSFASGTPDPATGVAPFRVNPQGDGVCNSVDVAGVCHVDSLNVGVNAGGVIGYPGSISNLGLVSGRSLRVITSSTGNAPFAVDNIGTVTGFELLVGTPPVPGGAPPFYVQANGGVSTPAGVVCGKMIGTAAVPFVCGAGTTTLTSFNDVVSAYLSFPLMSTGEVRVVDISSPQFSPPRTIGVAAVAEESNYDIGVQVLPVTSGGGVWRQELTIKNNELFAHSPTVAVIFCSAYA